MCNVTRESDENVCHDCGLRWDVREIPPECAMPGKAHIDQPYVVKPKIEYPIAKNKIDAIIEDAISDFLYYDRKSDEELPRGKIEEWIAEGKITKDFIVERFKYHILRGLNR